MPIKSTRFDVIVVGAGGSGLAAACSAAEHGGHVALLEKRPQPGGTTGIAVGSFTAAGTSLQRRAGIDDCAEDHAEDAGKFASPDVEALNNSPLRAYFLREAATTLQWLQSLGLAFVGPSPEPPNRVARMHNVVPGAKAYIATLQLALHRAGGEMICGCDARELLRDTAGRVVGVRALVEGTTMELHARRGVVLAAGDYANNPDMIARYKGETFREIEGINHFATGDGQMLAESVGANLVNMQVTYGPELRFVPAAKKPFQQWLPARGIWAWVMGAAARRLPKKVMQRLIRRLLVTWQHPESALFEDGAILVNQEGNRFANEKESPDREVAVARQPGKNAYMLLDGRLMELYSRWPHFISTAPDIAYAYTVDYQRLRPDITIASPTLDGLGTQRGIRSRALRQTVETYNEYASGRAADAFGRTGDNAPLETGPWMLLGPLKAYFTTTEGGAAVNERLQVLDAHGQTIPGLYAVGQNGLGGMILWGHGLHIAWAMTSGRLAGKFIMGGEE